MFILLINKTIVGINSTVSVWILSDQILWLLKMSVVALKNAGCGHQSVFCTMYMLELPRHLSLSSHEIISKRFSDLSRKSTKSVATYVADPTEKYFTSPTTFHNIPVSINESKRAVHSRFSDPEKVIQSYAKL